MSSRAATMPSKYNFSMILMLISVTSTLIWAMPLSAAMDPRFELDPQALGVPAASTPKMADVKASKRSVPARGRRKPSPATAHGTIHVVKSGDNLFKILMRDYGLSNDEAEAFIEEIRRENNIYDIKRLKIGQKITIPPVRRSADGTIKGLAPTPLIASTTGGVAQSFRLESAVNPLSEQEANARIRQTWDRMLPPLKGEQKPVMLQSPTFSLTLDPQRYPVYATMDNGRILVDQNASIPPLVRALITGKDPSVRIVSESPTNGKRFLSAMLESAGFYSVEENFSVDFGADPKLTIRSDFKIEKTPESLIKQDVLLMNSGREPFPPVIGKFLKNEGFTVLEPFASSQSVVPSSSRPLYQILSKKQYDIVDSLLTSMSVSAGKDRRLDVFAAENNGISLSVNAERYFEYGGQRYVVTRFVGDPVTYTLFRILETKGYQVIVLEHQDDFRKISDKLLSRMRIQGAYSQYTMGDTGANYSLLMSGYKLEGAGFPVGGLFLTNLELDHVIRDILTENGYSITTK